MKPHFKQKHPLFVALTAMTVSILTLFALSYIIVINSSNRLNTNAAELKIVTSQRSLSEEITNSVAADNLEGKIWGPPLRNLLNSFSYFHRTLLYGDAAKNIAPLSRICSTNIINSTQVIFHFSSNWKITFQTIAVKVLLIF